MDYIIKGECLAAAAVVKKTKGIEEYESICEFMEYNWVPTRALIKYSILSFSLVY